MRTEHYSPPGKKIHLLSIGVNQYDDSSFQNLNCPLNDALAITELFKITQNSHEITIKALLNPQIDEIIEQLQGLTQIVELKDIMILYYSGHGTKTSSILGRDSHKNDPTTAISFAKLREVFDNINARIKILILDSCSSGGVINKPALLGAKGENEEYMEPVYKQYFRGNGYAIITGAKYKKPAFEPSNCNHSFFTQALLNVFSQKKEEFSLFDSISEIQEELHCIASQAGCSQLLCREIQEQDYITLPSLFNEKLKPYYGSRIKLYQHIPRAENHVDRFQLIEEYTDILLKEDLFIQGIGGLGKTTIARDICETPHIQNAFFHGIIWVHVGQQPDFYTLFQKVCHAFEGRDYDTSSLDILKNKVVQIIENKIVFFVIDDIWEEKHWDEIKILKQKHTRMLITGRNAVTGIFQKKLSGLKQKQALKLLNKFSGESRKNTLDQNTYIIEKLGGHPLAIKLTGSLFAQGYTFEDWKSAFEHSLSELGDGGAGPNHNVDLSLKLSIDFVKSRYPHEFKAFKQIAVLPQIDRLKKENVETVWKITLDNFKKFHLQRFIMILRKYALLDNVSEEYIILHNLVRKYLEDVEFKSLRESHLKIYEYYSFKRKVNRSWESVVGDGYFHGHIVHHMLQLGKHEEAMELFANDKWLYSHMRQSEFTHDSYIKNLNLLWDFVDNKVRDNPKENSQYFLEIIRYSLIMGNIHSFCENYCSTLIMCAYKDRKWSFKKVKSVISKITNPYDKMRIYIAFLQNAPFNKRQFEEFLTNTLELYEKHQGAIDEEITLLLFTLKLDEKQKEEAFMMLDRLSEEKLFAYLQGISSYGISSYFDKKSSLFDDIARLKSKKKQVVLLTFFKHKLSVKHREYLNSLIMKSDLGSFKNQDRNLGNTPERKTLSQDEVLQKVSSFSKTHEKRAFFKTSLEYNSLNVNQAFEEILKQANYPDMESLLMLCLEHCNSSKRSLLIKKIFSIKNPNIKSNALRVALPFASNQDQKEICQYALEAFDMKKENFFFTYLFPYCNNQLQDTIINAQISIAQSMDVEGAKQQLATFLFHNKNHFNTEQVNTLFEGLENINFWLKKEVMAFFIPQLTKQNFENAFHLDFSYINVPKEEKAILRLCDEPRVQKIQSLDIMLSTYSFEKPIKEIISYILENARNRTVSEIISTEYEFICFAIFTQKIKDNNFSLDDLIKMYDVVGRSLFSHYKIDTQIDKYLLSSLSQADLSSKQKNTILCIMLDILKVTQGENRLFVLEFIAQNFLMSILPVDITDKITNLYNDLRDNWRWGEEASQI